MFDGFITGTWGPFSLSWGAREALHAAQWGQQHVGTTGEGPRASGPSACATPQSLPLASWPRLTPALPTQAQRTAQNLAGTSAHGPDVCDGAVGLNPFPSHQEAWNKSWLQRRGGCCCTSTLSPSDPQVPAVSPTISQTTP